ncbi:MAG: NAD(P)-dependent oxidoreductase [Hyphomicrobiaceae bacterium]|nr:MAG: NAD(P)-dependent oxidoreductase [Hyphomicrobiaceae bacterium]
MNEIAQSAHGLNLTQGNAGRNLRPVRPFRFRSRLSHTSTTIAFIGFGEVGRRFSRDLMARESVGTRAYDVILDDTARKSVIEDAARAIGVVACPTAREACMGADIVISAVTADQTEVVARQAKCYLAEGQLYLDVNSASPATKRRAAAHVEKAGARYVEGAVMAPVMKPGIKVPILAGGPAAHLAAERLNVLGMNLTPVAVEHGRASAIKLCRSIMIKGLEALIVDCARASSHWGVETEVYGSLSETFPSIDWPALAINMAERVATHGLRRAAEMQEAGDMLAEMGFDPSLARAVADAQMRGANSLKKSGGG